MATPTFFNAAFYLETYPDLVANGITPETAFDHFEQFGETELRVPSAEYVGKVNTSSVFDYVMANADLRAAFGVSEDATALTKEQQNNGIVHYWTFGVNEDRPDALIDYVPGETPADQTELTETLDAVVTAQDALKATKIEINKEMGLGYTTDKAAADTDSSTFNAAIIAENALKMAAVNTAAGSNILATNDSVAAKTKIVKLQQQELDATADLAKAKMAAKPSLTTKANTLAVEQAKYEKIVKDAAGNFEKFGVAANSLVTNGVVAAPPVLATSTDVTVTFAANAALGLAATDTAVYTLVPATGKYTGPVITTVAATPEAEANAKALLGNFGDAVQLLANNAKAFVVGGSVDKAYDSFEAALNATITAEGAAPAAGDANKAVLSAAGDVQFGAPAVDATSSAFNAITTTGKGKLVLSEAFVTSSKAAADFKVVAEKYLDSLKYEAQFEKADQAATNAASALTTLATEEGLELHNKADDSATDGNDLFVFGDNASTIYDFGQEGDDMFYFGAKYSFVEIEEGKIQELNVGTLDGFEIFAQQNGSDVILYVETESFQGNSEKGAFAGETIKLAGVSLEDLNFADGFLVA